MKLFTLIDAIPKRELQSAEKFLSSPYFTQKEIPLLLFQQLRPWYKHFEKLDRETIFQQLRPQESFDAKWWNDRCSELNKLLETFLQIQHVRKETHQNQQLKRAAFKAYDLDKEFIKTTHKLILDHQQNGLTASIQHFHLWDCFHDLYTHSPVQMDRLKFEQAAQHQLDLYYWTQKLALQANIASSTQGKELAINEPYWQAILHQVDQLKELPINLRSYRKLIRLFEEGCSLVSFQEATQAFIDSRSNLKTPETSFLFMIWCNLGSSQFSKGQTDFIHPVFKLYQFGIQEGLFLQQGTLPGRIFINVCIMAAQAKEYAWLKLFQKNYSRILEPYLKQETLALAQAFAAFHQQQFLQARTILDNISSTDLHFRIRLHSLSVRCLLELHLQNDSFYQVLRRKVRAFKRMISSKKKLHQGRKDAYLNFADLSLGLAKLTLPDAYSTQKHAQLRHKITTTKPLVLKNWLSQKLSVLPPLPKTNSPKMMG